jgi:tetratricopeptide (TPR) repeat protein
MRARARHLVAPAIAAAASLLFLSAITTAPAAADVPRGARDKGVESLYRSGRPAVVTRALRAIDRKDDERASREADRALRQNLDRNDRELMLHAGCVSRLRMGKLDEALDYCDAAVEVGGSRHWIHLVNRGNLHLDAGRRDAAIADFEAATQWLVEHKIEGEPLERVRLAMEYALPSTPPAAVLVSDDTTP